MSKRIARITLLAFATAVLVGGISLAAAPPDAESPEKLPAGQARTVIPVKGMTCEGCTSAITYAVKKLDGVVDVKVDHEKGNAAVTYEKEKVDVDKIVAAINKTGFEASKPNVSDEKGTS